MGKILMPADEVEFLVYEHAIETEKGFDKKYYRTNTTIVRKDHKFYKVYWEQSIFDHIADDFIEQEAQEVTLKTHKKTIVVTEWVVKEE